MMANMKTGMNMEVNLLMLASLSLSLRYIWPNKQVALSHRYPSSTPTKLKLNFLKGGILQAAQGLRTIKGESRDI